MKKKTVAILQPGFIPWLGFFEQFTRVDLFIYLDDVQYTKADWRSRNRIRTDSKEGWTWLTVPVKKGPEKMPLREARIDYAGKWTSRHLNLMRQFYGKAPFFKTFFDPIEELYSRRMESLVDFDVELTALFLETLKITTPVIFSSALNVGGGKCEKLLRLCQACQADYFYDGAAAQSFIDDEHMRKNGVEMIYQRYTPVVYRQMYQPFVPYLSILDLLFNVGSDEGLTIINAGAQSDKDSEKGKIS